MFPSVSAKEQMNGAVIEIRVVLQVLVDHLADFARALRKARKKHRIAAASHLFVNPFDLRRFTASVDAFKNHQRTAGHSRHL